MQEARPITSFNKLFTERDLPKGKPYRWTADDGTTVEGMLMYPPGKFEAQNLPTVRVHPRRSATMPTAITSRPTGMCGIAWPRPRAGWCSSRTIADRRGYGDKFRMQIVPDIVSRPGKDILEGVDALVKDGIADPRI